MTMAKLATYGQPGELPENLPPAKPLYFGPGANALLYNGSCIVIGWSLYNASSSTDVATLRDGGDGNGQPFAFWRCPAASTSDTENIGLPGVILQTGLYVTVANGHIQGTVWVIPL